MEYLQTGIAVFFAVLSVYVVWKKHKKEKLSTVVQVAWNAYQWIRKENLLGRIIKDDRLIKGLEMVEETLHSAHGISMDAGVKKITTEAFKSFHAKDKNLELSMNSVAVEPKKKNNP